MSSQGPRPQLQISNSPHRHKGYDGPSDWDNPPADRAVVRAGRKDVYDDGGGGPLIEEMDQDSDQDSDMDMDVDMDRERIELPDDVDAPVGRRGRVTGDGVKMDAYHAGLDDLVKQLNFDTGSQRAVDYAPEALKGGYVDDMKKLKLARADEVYQELQRTFDLEDVMAQDPDAADDFFDHAAKAIVSNKTDDALKFSEQVVDSELDRLTANRKWFVEQQTAKWLTDRSVPGRVTFDQIVEFMKNPLEAKEADVGTVLGHLESSQRAELSLHVYTVWWLVNRRLLDRIIERERRRAGLTTERTQPPLGMEDLVGADDPLLRGDEVKKIFKSTVDWRELHNAVMYAKKNDNGYLNPDFSFASCDPQNLHLSSAQRFLLRYFRPSLPIKGMLLWWSVGTGKTCAAISLASHNFEPNWLTTWVTKPNLKDLVFRDIFGRTRCHYHANRVPALDFAKLASATPATQQQALMDNTSWLVSHSYETFTNACQPLSMRGGKGHAERSVKRQKELGVSDAKERVDEDVLYRVFIAIDEAALLFDPVKARDFKADVGVIRAAVYRSYEVSEANSCRLLLFTATPLARHPMDFVRMLNLLQEKQTLRVLGDDGAEMTDAEFDARAITAEEKDRSAYINGSLIPRLLQCIHGRVSYYAVTGQRPMFPAFNVVRSIYVPVGRLQIAAAVGECTETDETSNNLARCLKRVDLASDVFRRFPFDPSVNQLFSEHNAFFRRHLVALAPKYHYLIAAIKDLNRKDWEAYGHLHKFVVYLDFRRPIFAQTVLSAFAIHGMPPAVWYSADQISVTEKPAPRGWMEPGFEWTPTLDKQTKGLGAYPKVAMLTHGTVNGRKLTVSGEGTGDVATDDRRVLEMFNKRSQYDADGKVVALGNEYGDWCQGLIIDINFREGIDLFDVKRFFNLSPAPSIGDNLQALGRVQRRCGNSGLIRRAADGAAFKDVPPKVAMDNSSMEYYEFRSYLPRRITNPSSEAKKMPTALDQLAVKNASEDYHPNMFTDEKLNKANLVGAKGQSIVDDPVTGKPFVGTQAKFIERLLMGASQYEDDAERRKFLEKNRVDVEILARSHYGPIVFKPKERAAPTPVLRERPPSDAPSRPSRGRGRGFGRRRNVMRAARKPRASFTKTVPAGLRLDILRGIVEAGEPVIEQFIAKYNIKGAQRYIFDSLYMEMLRDRAAGKYADINAMLLTSAALFSVDYWVHRGVNDPMYTPNNVISYLVAPVAETYVQDADNGSITVRRSADEPRSAVEKGLKHMAEIHVDYSGQFARDYVPDDFDDLMAEVKRKANAASAPVVTDLVDD